MMKVIKEKFITPLIKYLVTDNDSIQVSAFHILAAGGFLVSLITGLYNLIAGIGLDAVFQNLLGAVFSIVLLLYTKKTGRYKGPMIITVLAIFLGLFTLLFQSGGGYKSGVPSFFIFAIVFTAFMLDGRIMPILVAVEIGWYGFLCIYTYFHPLPSESILNDQEFMIDVVTCQSIVSIALAVTMYLQIRVYKRKQEELNQAIIETKKANMAKSEFLAKMSHDIRTPLNTIMAMNELIVQNTSSPQIHEWVGNSDVSGTILLSQINDMLDISRIESGKFRLKYLPYYPNRLFRELADIWEIKAKSQGLDFEYRYSSTFAGRLGGDGESVLKIFNNLLGNALKYTKEGRVGMEVAYEMMEEKEVVRLVVRISDSGVGIAPEDIEKIFLPFERGGQNDSDEAVGTGLGLAIVQELVDEMEGSIHCESTLGKGTTFTISIPQDVDEWRESDNAANPEPKKKHQRRSERIVAPDARILVVDDNVYNRKVVGQLLGPALVQIDDVESGFEALEMLDIKNYDLVLMDLRMPKMDGEETLKKIREEYPDFATPIVALTADIMNGVEKRLLMSGFSDFVSKPVSSARLYDILRKYVPDKIVALEAEQDTLINKDNLDVWQDLLMPYGIDIKVAMESNAGSAQEIAMRMKLFKNYADEYAELADGRIQENYYIQIHSLKSMAKGIGAFLLADMAGAVELRKEDAYARKMHPLMVEEYERVCRGIEVLEERQGDEDEQEKGDVD
ncbi:MAG: response regulator [Eubacterium sp.]|nr:response regulator [Eubacterium sp.]